MAEDYKTLKPGIVHNVPRIGEVGRRPIWVQRSETTYSLLYAVSAGGQPSSEIRCRTAFYVIHLQFYMMK